MRLAKTGVVALGIGVLGIVGASPAVAANCPTEHFLGVNTSTADNAPSPVSATGPIHALGIDTELSDTKDRFAFPKGSLIIVHKAKHDTQSGDPKTCTGGFTETGTYTIASGTGAYKHAHGHGTYAIAGYFIGCDQNKPPLVSSVILKASGPLAL
jgi:hypothetical protein